ncbi:MAG: HEAT repeat domain-containing protein [Planctomycetota bacterium]|jgi:HEAT repeat protein
MRLAALVLLGAAALADEDVRARLEWEPAYEGYWDAFPRPLGQQAPEGVPLPQGLVDGRFGTIETVAGAIHLALDPKHDRLFLDRDLDGDLSDERARTFKTKQIKDTVLVPLEAGADPVPVSFTLWRKGDDGFKYLPNLHRGGMVELAGRLRKVALVDGDGDLRFDEPGADHAFLDLDGNGQLTTVRDSHEKLAIGAPFRARGQGFVAVVGEPHGAAIAFRPHKPVPAARPRWFDTWTPPATRRPDGPPPAPLSDLEARYRTAEHKARIALIVEIARWGNAESAKTLLGIATDAGAPLDLRVEAVYGLGQLPYVKHAPVVARIARQSGEAGRLRHQALWSLHYMAAPGRAKTYAALLKAESDPQRLGDSVACLTYVGTAEARKLVLQAFGDQEDAGLRRQIYHSGVHADQAGVPLALVRAALADADDMIHGDALRDLWHVDEGDARKHAYTVLPGVSRKHHLVWWGVRVLGYHGDKKAVEALLEAAKLGSDKTWSRVLSLLRPNRDPGGVRALALGLKHHDTRVRALCANALQEIPAPRVSAAIVQALRKEKKTDLIARLVNALAGQTDPRAVAELLRVAAQRDFPARSVAISALTRIGFEDPKVKAFFARRLGSLDWEDRIYALDAVARANAVELAPGVLASLEHKRWQVRLAAAQCLRRVRVGEAIPVLIARLGEEEHRRVRVAVADALFRLTGQEFFDDADGWKRWWLENRAGFAVPAQVPRRRIAAGRTVARFYGVPVYSERVCFVLDRSGSMDAIDPRADGKMRIERAKAELTGAVEKLRPGARFNAILFGTNVERWRKTLVPATAAHRAALEKHLQPLAPEGATNLWDALERALEDREVDTIYLMSDGAPNRGKWQRTYAILRELRQLNQTRRVAIHCVSVGTDSGLLRRIAADHGGTYVRR